MRLSSNTPLAHEHIALTYTSKLGGKSGIQSEPCAAHQGRSTLIFDTITKESHARAGKGSTYCNLDHLSGT